MEFLKRNWATFAFITAFLLLGLVGYRLYLDIELRADDERVNSTVENVRKAMEREPKTSLVEPAYTRDLNEQWAPLQSSVSDRAFMIYFPPLVRPVLDREPDVTCTFPGISNLQVNGRVGQVDLKWEFESINEAEDVVAVPPGNVIVQRRQVNNKEWTDVSSFSGTDQSEFTDTGVQPRARYEYRLLVKRGGETCEEGKFQKEEKGSAVKEVMVESDVELVLKSTGGGSALIRIKKFTSAQEEPKTGNSWIDVGDKIQANGLTTPYTLTDIQKNGEYSYFTLTEKTIWVNNKKRSVGKIDQVSIKRPRIIYKDDKGNVFKKWQPMDDPTSLYPVEDPPPWEAKSTEYDGFMTSVEELPWGEIPPNLRVDMKEQKVEATEEGEQTNEGANGEAADDQNDQQ